MNISVIDEAVRDHAIGVVVEAVRTGARPEVVLGTLVERLQPPLGGRVAALRWWLTPYYSLAMEAAHPDRVLLSQRFEFCASHRLHCPDFSDEENRRIFGECNHPSGHGHNYWLEPMVSVPVAGQEGHLCLAALERIVDERVIQRFDHRHLNSDVEEFDDLTPTVEHIARVCYELLETPIAEVGGRLERVTVWETDKTFCTYPVG
jgi:6-pyruvoyl-tetrahydropterin synthase